MFGGHDVSWGRDFLRLNSSIDIGRYESKNGGKFSYSAPVIFVQLALEIFE